jgi:hypothetical protein
MTVKNVVPGEPSDKNQRIIHQLGLFSLYQNFSGFEVDLTA